jgi:hypothetical protein
VALDYPDGSLWIWEEVTATDGSPLPAAAAFVASREAACAGALSLIRDASGAPVSLVALTAAEAADNAARRDGRRLAVRPRGGFVRDGVGFLYIESVLLGPGVLDVEPVTAELCRLDARARPCARAASPLWTGRDHRWGQAALLDGDGLAYLVGCFKPAAFADTCSLARVAPADADRPDAYRYHNAFDGWIEDRWNTTALYSAASAVSSLYLPRLARYASVQANIWESRVELRLAPAPWGPYGRPLPLLSAAPPPGWFIGGGVAHPSLAGADELVVSYHTTNAAAAGLHLVTLRLREGAGELP